MINEILEKNLDFIKAYDEGLAVEIASVTSLSTTIEMVYTDLNEPNLAVEGVSINSQSGAQADAEHVVSTASHNNKASIHVVFGLGFGYTFKEAVERAQGSVILYEPNVELLRVAMEMVDFSDVLSKNNVLVTNNLEGLEAAFDRCFRVGSETAVFCCPYHRAQTAELNKLLEKLGILQGIASVNTAQRASHSAGYAHHAVYNLHQFLECSPISALKDSLKNIPAVIIASGPSLNDNVEELKKYRSKAVYFGVSSSLAALNENGIYPDFVSMIETYDARGLISGCDISRTSLICEPYTNYYVLAQPFKSKFVTASDENTANDIYEKAFGLAHEEFETKGTVSYNALSAAKYMGCNPIILVGQDLAYIDGNCYSAKSPLSDFKCRKRLDGSGEWEFYVEDRERAKQKLYGHLKNYDSAKFDPRIDRKLAELQAQLMRAQNNAGEEIATGQVFALFAEYYKSFARKFASTFELYNTSEKGIHIDGFRCKKLGDILAAHSDVAESIDMEAVCAFRTEIALDMEFINREYAYLSEAVEIIKSGKDEWARLLRDLSRKVLTEKSAALLKRAIAPYLLLCDGILKKSVIYRESTYASRTTMELVMNEVAGRFDFEAAKKVAEGLSSLYETDLLNLERRIRGLDFTKRKTASEVGCTAG